MPLNLNRPHVTLIRPQIGPPPFPSEGAGTVIQRPGKKYYQYSVPESVERFVIYTDGQAPAVTAIYKTEPYPSANKGQTQDFATELDAVNTFLPGSNVTTLGAYLLRGRPRDAYVRFRFWTME